MQRRRRSRSLLTFLTIVLFGMAPDLVVPDSARSADYKQAPSSEELDARAREFIVDKRIGAIVLIAATFIGGLISGVVRRRAKVKARALSEAEAGKDDDR